MRFQSRLLVLRSGLLDWVRVYADLGGLNIVVNNAGVALRNRFVETTPEEWKRQIDICLYGAIHISKGGGAAS